MFLFSMLMDTMSCMKNSPDIASSCPVAKLRNALMTALNIGMALYIKTAETQMQNIGQAAHFDPSRLHIDYSECKGNF